MATFIKAMTECICGLDSTINEFPEEKQAILSHDRRTAEEIAQQVVNTLISAEKGGKHLEKALNDIVGTNGW